MAINPVRCGKWVVADYLSLLRQVGVVTDDELQAVGTPAVATPVP